MVDISVIIPERDAGDALVVQVDGLCRALDRFGRTHEVLCVDAGSIIPTATRLASLAAERPQVRLLRLTASRETGAALAAGIAAARGESIVAVEAGPHYPAELVTRLIGQLARADVVCGRPRRRGWAKLAHRLGRIPRWLLIGLEVRDPDCLLWAARREALEGIELVRGLHRYLPWMVARRGYRVCEMPVEPASAPVRRRAGANPLDLLAAWWWCRRWQDHSFDEVSAVVPFPRIADNVYESFESQAGDPPLGLWTKTA